MLNSDYVGMAIICGGKHILKIHCLTNVSFEDAANIGQWAADNGHQLQYTHLYNDQDLPQMEEFDVLAIMGGPMNIYEDDKYPWLKKEKQFIERAIDNNKKVIGICLGAQLIADILGGTVTRNQYAEIGWFDVKLTERALNNTVLSNFSESFTAFHWHGDTFTIPPGAIHLAISEACINQAFQYGDNVLDLQFHIDYSKESVEKMLVNCDNELIEGPYIQTQEQIRQRLDEVANIKKLLYKLLDEFEY